MIKKTRRQRATVRGSSDLTVALLLTAAGAAMVGLTVPSMFKSSATAANTFDHQVQILERGANGGAGGGGSSAAAAAPGFEVGGAGITAPSTTTLGNSGASLSGSPSQLGGAASQLGGSASQLGGAASQLGGAPSQLGGASAPLNR